MLSFSPNSAKNNINISYTSYNTAQITIRVTGILGQQVYSASKTVMPGVNTWAVHLNIPKGNYYLSVVNNTGSVITKYLRIE